MLGYEIVKAIKALATDPQTSPRIICTELQTIRWELFECIRDTIDKWPELYAPAKEHNPHGLVAFYTDAP